MQVAKITCRNNTVPKVQVNKTLSFSSNTEVIDDGYYVKIPKKKYQRDKILNYIVNGILTIDIIYSLCKVFGKGNKPFP